MGWSTFQAADESRKGKPFIAVQSGSDFLYSDKLGGNAGNQLSSLFCGTESFFSFKEVKERC